MSLRKPTGETGPFRVEMNAGEVVGGWAKIPFPSVKADIEKTVVGYFERAMTKNGASIVAARQNAEADFDFTLTLPGGTVDLELREIHYQDGSRRPYESRDIKIKSCTYAEQIRDAVQHKSARYSPNSKVPVHLLLYLTHWRFQPNEVVIRLAQHFFAEQPPIFENVFLLQPLDDRDAEVRVLYPSINPLEGHRLEEFVDHWYLNLDPARANVVVAEHKER